MMVLDERGERALIFIGDGPQFPKLVIEKDDEATLYHTGNLIMALIKNIDDNHIIGLITRSSYDPDLHTELISGKEVKFLEQNIFGVSKKRLQA